ncbi:MAG: hypothetical protein R3A80_00530 [Bdellovibrionota bacterium]
MKKYFFLLLTTLLAASCAHSDKPQPIQAKGYGDFLFMPPGSIAIRNFIDKDGDNVDDRYQMAPGEKGLPMGHYYKKSSSKE